MENNLIYRAIDPYSDEDINKYLKLRQDLDNYLNANKKPMTEEQIKWLRIRMGALKLLLNYDPNGDYWNGKNGIFDEYCFVCEHNNEFIGFSFICTYNVVDSERTKDDTGIISEIYVKDGYRGGDIAYNLLQMALEKLIEAGKNTAVLEVQEDNPNRFLHFAIADKILSSKVIKRKNGTKTTNYDLFISDLNKIKRMTARELGVRAVKIKRDFEQNNLSQPRFILDK